MKLKKSEWIVLSVILAGCALLFISLATVEHPGGVEGNLSASNVSDDSKNVTEKVPLEETNKTEKPPSKEVMKTEGISVQEDVPIEENNDADADENFCIEKSTSYPPCPK